MVALVFAAVPYLLAFKELLAGWETNIETLNDIVFLLSAIYAKDYPTYIHSKKVAEYSVCIARAIGLTCEETKKIKLAAYLHDLGKVITPINILRKRGPLRQYPGYNIL